MSHSQHYWGWLKLFQQCWLIILIQKNRQQLENVRNMVGILAICKAIDLSTSNAYAKFNSANLIEFAVNCVKC